MDKKRRWTRGGRITLVAFLVLGFLVAGFLLVLHLTSPSPPARPAAVAEKTIPSEWTTQAEAPAAAVAATPWTSAGSLIFVADGHRFGDEAYQLDVSPDGATLTSTGRFQFKIVLANVVVTFQQTWVGTGSLEPSSYALHVDAPLGQGQEISGAFEDSRLLVVRNGAETSISVARDRAVVLGMFSTYALIPLLFSEREEDGVARFDALVFGGPPGTGTRGSGGLPVVVVERVGPVNVSAGGLSVAVDQYRVRSPYGDSTLYARGKEFLALTAGTAERPFLVYRSDYFPDGFSLAGTAQ